MRAGVVLFIAGWVALAGQAFGQSVAPAALPPQRSPGVVAPNCMPPEPPDVIRRDEQQHATIRAVRDG